MTTKVRVLQGVLATDTTATNLTSSGLGTPTGAVVMVTYATALNTDTDHACLGFGVADFTTEAAITTNAEDAVGTTADNRVVHQETDALEIHAVGTATVSRSANITTTTDGISITPNESGTAYRVTAIVFWGTDVHAFSAGAGTASAGTFNVAHGMSAAPKAGIVFYSSRNVTDDARWQMSAGFFTHVNSTFTNACSCFNAAQAINTAVGGRVSDTYCSLLVVEASGALADGVSVTANDATNTTFTAANSAMDGDVVGLLLELDDIDPYLEVIDTPTSAAADWTESGPNFTPQAVVAVTSLMQTLDTAIASSDAASFGVWAFDEDNNKAAVMGSYEYNVATTNSKSRMESSLYFFDHAGTTAFDMDPTSAPFTTSGFTIPNAQIQTANGTARKWPMLFFMKAVTITNVDTDDIVGSTQTNWTINGSGFGAD